MESTNSDADELKKVGRIPITKINHCTINPWKEGWTPCSEAEETVATKENSEKTKEWCAELREIWNRVEDVANSWKLIIQTIQTQKKIAKFLYSAQSTEREREAMWKYNNKRKGIQNQKIVF